MKKTNTLKLGLWEGTDFPNIMIPNNNMEILDNTYGTLKNEIEKYDEEFVSIGSDIENVKLSVSETAQSIELLDNFDTKVKNSLFTFINNANEPVEIEKIVNFNRVITAQISETSTLYYVEPHFSYNSTYPSGANITYPNSTASSNTNRVLQGFDCNSTINIKDLTGEIDNVNYGIIPLGMCVNLMGSTTKRNLIPQFRGIRFNGSTPILDFNAHQKYWGTFTIDSQNTITNSIDTEDFETQFRVSGMLAILKLK